MRTRLFIGDMEADLVNAPDILFNYQTDDVASPGAVKNSYSSTVSLIGTKQNDKIFNQFWSMEHKTMDGEFDPSKKTPFKIFVDSELVQDGYCKLDKVTQKGNLYQYDLTLFGGLGEFLYNLSQNEDGSKKTLADLQMFTDEEATEPSNFDFVITKDTVAEAWENIDSYSSKWATINFAPCLNGKPNQFDSSKCLVNINGTSGPRGGTSRLGIVDYTEDGKTYSDYNGFVLGEMSRDRTADEMREFRSYLMRPVLRVQKTIENICRPENNGGWKVNLDSAFFNGDNPWWSKSYVTLASINTLEYTGSEEVTGVTLDLGTASTSGRTSGTTTSYEETRNVNLSGDTEDKVYSIGVDFTLSMSSNCTSATTLYPSCRYTSLGQGGSMETRYYGSVFVQLVAYDGGGSAVAGSKLLNLTGAYGSRRVSERGGRSQIYTIIPEPGGFDYPFPWSETTYDTDTDGFTGSNGSYSWGNGKTMHLDINKVPRGATVKLLVYKLVNNPWLYGRTYNDVSKLVWERHEVPGEQTTYTMYEMSDFTVNLTGYGVSVERNEAMRSGTEVRMADLLKTSYSPADFLLSYCKIFGLYIVKDQTRKQIDILSKKSFFYRDIVKDISDKIDWTQVETTPLVAKAKWYKWDHVPSGEYAEEYKKTYGKDYGEYDYATSYDFDNNTEDVLKGDRVFKGAVQVLERSTDFWYTGNDMTRPWMYDGYKYVLYCTTDNSDTHEVEVPLSTSVDVATKIQGMEYYDLYDKVQLHGADNNPSGGEGVLLFFDRMVPLVANDVQLKYYITDDNATMAIVNDGKPCWLYCNSEYDEQGNQIAVQVSSAPKFSRYLVTDAGVILNSWDFGKPEEIYVPGVSYNEKGAIFPTFWKSYIEDLYNRDTRRVKAKMVLDGKVTTDWLRQFYFFSNSIWRLDKITGCDLTERKLTECEFVKVQDVANYDNEVPSMFGGVKIEFSGDIPASGGTVNYTITVDDGGSWYFETPYDSDVIWSATAGTGNYTGTVTINNPNASTTDRTVQVFVFALPARYHGVLTQKAEQATLMYIGTSPSGGSSSDIIPASGGTAYFQLSATTNWSASTTTFSSVSPSGGTRGNYTLSAVMGENATAVTRTGRVQVELSTGAMVRSSFVTQEAGGGVTFSVTPTSIEAPYGGGTYTLDINSSDPWVLYHTYNFLQFSATAGTAGHSVITVTVPRNTGSDRRSDVTFKLAELPNGDTIGTVTVVQYALLENMLWYKSNTGALNIDASGMYALGGTYSADTVSSVTVSTDSWSPHLEVQCTFPSASPSQTLGVIKGYAFYNLPQLTAVRWYTSDTPPENNAIYGIFGGAFSRCTGLKTLEVYGFARLGDGTSDRPFSGCTSLESVVINGAVPSNNNTPLTSGCLVSLPALKYLEVPVCGKSNSTYVYTSPDMYGCYSGCTALEEIVFYNNPESSVPHSGSTWGVGTVADGDYGLGAVKRIRFNGITSIKTATYHQMFSRLPLLTDVWWDGTMADAQATFTQYRCPAYTVHCSDGDVVIPSTLDQ